MAHIANERENAMLIESKLRGIMHEVKDGCGPESYSRLSPEALMLAADGFVQTNA